MFVLHEFKFLSLKSWYLSDEPRETFHPGICDMERC